MSFLLDTHILLWSLLEPEHLTESVRSTLEAPESELWLSPISIWESLVLAQKGRVALEPDPVTWVREVLGRVPVREAPLNHEVAIQSRLVDLPHPDPADRFLAATAHVYDLTLVTADRRLIDAPRLRVLANR